MPPTEITEDAPEIGSIQARSASEEESLAGASGLYRRRGLQTERTFEVSKRAAILQLRTDSVPAQDVDGAALLSRTISSPGIRVLTGGPEGSRRRALI